MGAEQVSGEVLSWLKTLPLAPEYHPTIQEFQDPISYIFKIESEASKYGICKIVPPVPPLSKKSVISNFNRSIAARTSSKESPNSKSQPTFTTRQQQVGFCPRKQRPVQKSVWQSGEHYTLQQFEAKSKGFERNYFKNKAKKVASPSPLEIETLFWKANGDRPFSVEYANDMPGSAFGPFKERRWRDSGETGLGAANVGDTGWNMRGVARSNSSLLRFMKEEIPGVTSPMVYVAMMFSWFAWHVEDHDFHSLNYLHFGAGKTWYGVPRDAAIAFEEVIRVHGFGEEINPLVIFALLGEKTTVMSPEVLISAGVPCCRLVQNAGEFVVTFPRAYHSGFSHGFNCGEASNIATPEWLRFAKDAAIRRAAINYPPMVSHFQLLYDLALEQSSSSTSNTSIKPRSSRLKDKRRGEGESLVKQLFVQDIMQNNSLLHTLGKGSSVVILPQNSSEEFVCSNLRSGSRYKVKPVLPLSLSSSEEAINSSKCSVSEDTNTKNQVDKRFKTYYSRKTKFASVDQGAEVPSSNDSRDNTLLSQSVETERKESTVADGLSDRGLFSCVKCGIWPFACVAIIQPTESTSQYLVSPQFSIDDLLGFDELNDGSVGGNLFNLEQNCASGSTLKDTHFNQSSDCEFEKVEDSDAEMKRSSALGLLALTYGNSSDSEEEEEEIPPPSCKYQRDHSSSPFSHQDHTSELTGIHDLDSLNEGKDSAAINIPHPYRDREFSRVDSEDSDLGSTELAEGFSNRLPSLHDINIAEMNKSSLPFSKRSDDDSSRVHVFCLEHALELEQLLRPVGGVHIMLLCHPDYPKVEHTAKLVAEELENDHYWNDTPFKIATKEEKEQIQLALQSEEETPKSGDWAVKLGINLYYSSILCRSPLYSKQMPYNSVIYNVFGCSTPLTSPKEPNICGKRSSRQRKIVMAGKWCGKVWMSNQVHPFLVKRDTEEEENITFGSQMKIEDKIVGRSCAPRTARKRKSKFEDRSVKKAKFHGKKITESDSNDSVDPESPQEHKRNAGKAPFGTRSMKKAGFSATEFADADSDDSVDVGIHQKHKKNVAKKIPESSRLSEKGGPTDMEMEDSEPETLQGFRRSIRSQRFKGKTSSQGAFNRCLVANQDDSNSEAEMESGPASRPRRKAAKPRKEPEIDTSSKKQLQKSKGKKVVAKQGPNMRLPTITPPVKKGRSARVPLKAKGKEEEEEHLCDIEGCTMSFGSAEELSLHKRNICPVEDCYKKFFSHKYLVQHRRVHEDARPLKCPWKGCKMTFKWAWARTEHLRVHTGARPYVCKEPGCGQTFRFVSDFSRHKRKTGHSIRKKT
ncbi:hypothetical protein V2J09_011959 [Rumex salicifolius]